MSEHSVYETAPAKINIHLRVGNRRADGFHNIESIFQSISLADSLYISLAKRFSVRCLNFTLANESSLKKAYEAFCKFTGFSNGVDVLLLKKIPACAGLGGGSSDAVAMLRGLRKLSGFDISDKILYDMALQIGSDCPFFIKAGSAFVSGRGELIKQLEGKSAMGLLLYQNIESKTAQAYDLLDNERVRAGYSDFGLLEDSVITEAIYAEYKKAVSDWGKGEAFFRNDFETVIFKTEPKIKKAKEALLKAGADFASMTGSGSAVFGLFESDEKLRKAIKILKPRFDFCEPFLFC